MPSIGKLLLINQYFWPDRAATAQLLADLAEDAAEAGFAVTALAGRGSYAPSTDDQLPRRESWRGVDVRRVWCSDFGRGNIVGRLLDYLTFLASSFWYVCLGARHDVVVCLSTPPLVSVLGLVARVRGSCFVYKVEDLYPDVAVALGSLSPGSPATLALRKLSSSVLRRADVCVALDGSMEKVLRDRGARRVEIIPNWSDGEAIRPDPIAGRRFRDSEALPSGVLVLYSGNLGMAHRFDAVVAAARKLEELGNPCFLFVGSGVRLPSVKDAAAGLTNVRFLPYQPRERLHDLYNAADVHLVTLQDNVAGLLVPSKYPAALAAGKPVLVVGGAGTDLHQEVESRDVGWVCSHDSEQIVAALGKAASDPEVAARRCRNARALFEEKYRRASAVGRWITLLEQLALGRGR